MDNEHHLSDVGPGWHDLIKPLIERCNAEGVQIVQVKEKFGGLRFYTHGTTSPELTAAIDDAEIKSFGLCEECGEPGQPTRTGWVKTLCAKHTEERLQKLLERRNGR